MFGLLSLLIGCIPTGAWDALNTTSDTGLQVVDSGEPRVEPSMEPSTEPSSEPSDETDTQDTEDTAEEPECAHPHLDVDLNNNASSVEDPNYGRGLTTGWHVLMEGSYVFETTLMPSHQAYGLLDFNKPWGFGLTLAPYSEKVMDYFFGNVPNDSLGFELPILEVRNRQVSLHFEIASDEAREYVLDIEQHPFPRECEHAILPRVIIRRLVSDTAICTIGEDFPAEARSLYAHESELMAAADPPVLCMDDYVQDFEQDGLQFIIMNTKMPSTGGGQTINKVKAFLGFPGFDDPVTLLNRNLLELEQTSCGEGPESNDGTGEVDLFIGRGHAFQTPQAFDLFHLNARVDNMILFEPSVDSQDLMVSHNDFIPFWLNGSESGGSTLYHDLDILVDDITDDGIIWWNFEQPRDLNGELLDLSGVNVTPAKVTDQSNQRLLQVPPLEFVSTCDLVNQPTVIGDPSYLYRNQNNNLLVPSENWSCDDGDC